MNVFQTGQAPFRRFLGQMPQQQTGEGLHPLLLPDHAGKVLAQADDHAPHALIADQQVGAVAHDQPGQLQPAAEVQYLPQLAGIGRSDQPVRRAADLPGGVRLQGSVGMYPGPHGLLQSVCYLKAVQKRFSFFHSTKRSLSWRTLPAPMMSSISSSRSSFCNIVRASSMEAA